MTKVFVTGANGFIAQHILKTLLERGYTVVGSVRSTAKAESVRANFNSPRLTLEVISDLGAENAFDAVLKSHQDIEYFFHTASPVTFSVADVVKDIITPAVESTKSVLNAVKKYGVNIKKLVYTSSNAAISTVGDGPDVTVNEASWNRKTYEESLDNAVSAYRISKTLAERAAWDFVETEKPHFKLTTVTPPLVLGPQAFASELDNGTLNFSNSFILGLLKLGPNDAEKLPELAAYFVDVKTLALAHVLAIETPETDGQRVFPAKDRVTSQQILDIIRERFPHLAANLPVGEPKKYVYTMATVDNSKTNKVLGLKYLSLEETIAETVQQYLDAQK